jgi:hypothetical protein
MYTAFLTDNVRNHLADLAVRDRRHTWFEDLILPHRQEHWSVLHTLKFYSENEVLLRKQGGFEIGLRCRRLPPSDLVTWALARE